MQYAYSQQPLDSRGRPSNWQAFNDPALMATLPAAALLYRRGDVRESDTVYAFAPSEAQLFDQPISPDNAVALRTAAEKGKLLMVLPSARELPWIEKSPIPERATIIADPQRSLIESDAKSVTSDTGELHRDWEDGIFTINTGRTEAALGRIGGRAIHLAAIDIAVRTAGATVVVQSLDDNAIDASDQILISLGSRSVPLPSGEARFSSEPVVGELAIRARKGMKLYPQRGASKDEPGIGIPYEDGRYKITLDPGLGTYWLILK